MASLHQAFLRASERYPDRPAVREADGSGASYQELRALSGRVRDGLAALGVAPGDRVGVYLPKSLDGVAVLLGALEAGAAYVPVDPTSPSTRAAYILRDCAVRIVVTTVDLAGPLEEQFASQDTAGPRVVPLATAGGATGLLRWLDGMSPLPTSAVADPPADAPAYLLYTSGSTGRPKGVVISHQAATSFVDWCSATFEPTAADVFSSHAPFHFDLSIHDLFVSLKHGACVVLIGEELGRDPGRLAPAVARHGISIWYSTPSILSALASHGHLERHDWSQLRLVLFAGEVFPIPALRGLMDLWPRPRYFNLFGPTETNVCTWYEAPCPLPADRIEPLPIGRVCAHYRSRIVDGHRIVQRGDRGELLIAGPGVMSGYWNLPERNRDAFLADGAGEPWYRTGDIVSEEPDGTLLFHGRRDRMVKRHGYRIELGEIESALAHHPALAGAAVVARPDERAGVVIDAYLAWRGQRPSIVELKRYCVECLPRYMVPDRFVLLDEIPRTSTGKTDYQTLLAGSV